MHFWFLVDCIPRGNSECNLEVHVACSPTQSKERCSFSIYLCSLPLGQLKNRSFRTFFFDIMTTQNDHPRYVKHVLGRIICFSLYLGIGRRGGGLPMGLVHKLLVLKN